jgi:hypothetical protein
MTVTTAMPSLRSEYTEAARLGCYFTPVATVLARSQEEADAIAVASGLTWDQVRDDLYELKAGPEALRPLVAQVKAYALDHYDKGGWDILVEAWEDWQVAEAIAGASTLRGALRKLSAVVGAYSDQQADARNSAF